MASPALSSGPWGRVHSCLLDCRQGASCAQDGSSWTLGAAGADSSHLLAAEAPSSLLPTGSGVGIVQSGGKCALSHHSGLRPPFQRASHLSPSGMFVCVFESRVKELPLLRTFNSSAQTPYRLQRPQPRFRPRRPPPALRDHRPPRPSAQQLAQPILRNCGLRPRPPPPPRARPRPRPRPPRTRGRAQCLRGCCSPRRPRRACPVSGLASSVRSAASFPKKSRSDRCCGKAPLHACLPDPIPMPPWTLSFPALNLPM